MADFTTNTMSSDEFGMVIPSSSVPGPGQIPQPANDIVIDPRPEMVAQDLNEKLVLACAYQLAPVGVNQQVLPAALFKGSMPMSYYTPPWQYPLSYGGNNQSSVATRSGSNHW